MYPKHPSKWIPNDSQWRPGITGPQRFSAESVGGTKDDIRRVPELVPQEVAVKSGYNTAQDAPLIEGPEALADYDAIIVGTGQSGPPLADRMHCRSIGSGQVHTLSGGYSKRFLVRLSSLSVEPARTHIRKCRAHARQI